MKLTSKWLRQIVLSKLVMKLCDRVWRYSHSRNMEHNRRLWPYVREIKRDSYDAIEAIKVRPSSWEMKLTPFADVPRANTDTVHLVLSGPSVNEIDYNQLKLPCAMGVNGSIALRQQYDISFPYYVIIDDSFVRDRLALVKEIVAQKTILFARVSVLKEINLRVSSRLINCQFVAIEEIDTPAYRSRPSPKELREMAARIPQWALFDAQRYQGFSTDPQAGLFSARTVAYDALQLLVWLGFTEIYIHGLDLQNASREARFYESNKDRISSTLEKNFDEYIEPSFRKASQVLSERGVKVHNLSLKSALDEDVFSKTSWQELVH